MSDLGHPDATRAIARPINQSGQESVTESFSFFPLFIPLFIYSILSVADNDKAKRMSFYAFVTRFVRDVTATPTTLCMYVFLASLLFYICHGNICGDKQLVPALC